MEERKGGKENSGLDWGALFPLSVTLSLSLSISQHACGRGWNMDQKKGEGERARRVERVEMEK